MVTTEEGLDGSKSELGHSGSGLHRCHLPGYFLVLLSLAEHASRFLAVGPIWWALHFFRGHVPISTEGLWWSCH